MKKFLCPLFTPSLLFTVCYALLFSPVVKGKEVIAVYTTNGSTVHVNQNFRHGQRIEVPLAQLTNDTTREGFIQINSLLNFNHHVAIGDGAAGDYGSLIGNISDAEGSREPKKIASGAEANELSGASAEDKGKEPLPAYCKDKEQINRFVHVITQIPHDGCPSNIDAKLLEGINRRRACDRMAPLTLSAKLSTEAATEALRMLPNVKGFKPTRPSVGHYWASYWSSYASKVDQRYFNLLAYWDDSNRGRPYLKALNRYFNSKEWAETKEIGIGCAGRFARNGVYNRGTLLMAIFENPTQAANDTHKPEDEREDLDGDGKLDARRLPPYCAHESKKLRNIHSNVSVPLAACPASVLEQAIEGFAQQRVCAGMPRLIHTPEMATLATEWANNQSAGGLGWYQPNTPIAGQYNVGKDAPLSAEVIDLHELDIFNRWDEWKGLPKYVPGNGEPDRYFTPEEWARTREFGIGCAAYPYQPSKKNLFWIVVFFKHPGKEGPPSYCTDTDSLKMSVTATVTVPEKGCPPEIQKAAVEGFQRRRICRGLPEMAHNESIAAEASNYAADININDAYAPRYKPYGQFIISSREKPENFTDSGAAIEIKNFDIFEKFASWKERPWFTGTLLGNRYFTQRELGDTKEFGVGCASFAREGKNYFYLVAFFKYPGQNLSIFGTPLV